ncbi:MAG: type II secretion system F family protein [Alphaproteobacteria bacterium]|nr:type II secretion system F family protein [Alphaproteobacteria bacterium]
MMIALATALLVLALGGAAFAYAGGQGPSQKRVDAATSRSGSAARVRGGSEAGTQKRRNMQQALKEFEKKQAEKKPTMTLRRRLDMAGLMTVSARKFWMASAGVGLAVVIFCFVEHQGVMIALLAAFAAGLGLPRWVLSFLRHRREKRFTDDFANAIDVIVRSVKSGLPTSDALKIVATEFRDPVGGEFKRLCESMKVGVTLEQALKKMHESMPTTEVGFFAIVMSIQQKSGGNLSEALGNLSAVLRDRKRLLGKIKAMSSEAKASAMIIGSLPPVVGGIVYLTTPAYISLLFTERLGNLLLLGCAVWMGLGIFVMRKMINFKH